MEKRPKERGNRIFSAGLRAGGEWDNNLNALCSAVLQNQDGLFDQGVLVTSRERAGAREFFGRAPRLLLDS